MLTSLFEHFSIFSSLDLELQTFQNLNEATTEQEEGQSLSTFCLWPQVAPASYYAVTVFQVLCFAYFIINPPNNPPR